MRRSTLGPCALAMLIGCVDTPLPVGDSGVDARDAFAAPDAPEIAVDASRPDGSRGGPLPGELVDRIAAMPSGSWLALPGSSMSSACPGPAGFACWAVLGAWGGGTYDTIGDRVVIWGGGHGDSHVNNLFVFDVREGTWRRETEMPAGVDTSTVPASWRQIALETCGYYPRTTEAFTVEDAWLIPGTGYIRHELCDTPEIFALYDDQQPRSRHTYGAPVFDPERNRFCSLGGSGTFPSAQAGTRDGICYDFDDRRWSTWTANRTSGYVTTAVDDRGRAWLFAFATSPVLSYDLATGEIREHASTLGVQGTAAIDTRRGRAVVARVDGALTTLDLDAPDTLGSPTPAGAAPLGRFPGFDYAASEDRFYAWEGGRTVYALDPETFAWSRIDATGDDPGPSMTNGTYGRFRWAPNLGVFVLVNASSSYGEFSGRPHVFFFKP